MNIGIVDADLISQRKHRFPNLACMKISGYHKDKGDNVTLITEYIQGEGMSIYSSYYKLYDKIYVSKVFVDSTVPYELLNLSITEYGGTGFFYANALGLLEAVEHSKPDYHLYDKWIKQQRENGKVSDREFIYYEEYSIGFTTRYCNRHCKFCVNQHHNKVEYNSPVKEFLEKNVTRNKICLLDDNILAYDNWKEIFKELNKTGLPFEFKQGLDIRYLTEEKIKVIINSNIYYNSMYFAFDNIEEKDIIIKQLKLWRSMYQKTTNMYVLCAFDKDNKYDKAFWEKDIESTLERIKICIEFGVFPYIMRFRKYNSAPAPYRGMYINLASWCNQRNLFSRMSLNKWADKLQIANEKQLQKKRLYSTKRYLMEYAGQYPDIAYKYFDIQFNSDNKYEYMTKKELLLEDNRKIIQIADNRFKRRVIGKKPYKKLTVQNVIQNCDKDRIFYNGYDIFFSYNNLKYVYDNAYNNSNNILLKITEAMDITNRKLVILYIQQLVSKKGNVFININTLEYYNEIKSFIKEYTSLIINEETQFKNSNNGIVYLIKCNKIKTNQQLFLPINGTLSREKCFDIIFKQINCKDIVLSFFEQYNILKTMNQRYNTSCINITKNISTNSKHEVLAYLEKVTCITQQELNNVNIINN